MTKRIKSELFDSQTTQFYQEGRKAALKGATLIDCPYGPGQIKAMCAWRGAVHDYKPRRKRIDHE